MKHVSILIPIGKTSLSNIEGTYQILTAINGMAIQSGRKPLFDVHLVGIKAPITLPNGLFSIQPDVMIESVRKTDLIIIPAPQDEQTIALKNNESYVPWILDQYKNGAEVASFCVGAFLLAKTGLLNGKVCTTHWIHANEFRSMFPEVNLIDEKIMTEEDGIYTSGGAFAFLNLIIYLVEKYAGRQLAIQAAKIFAVDIDRSSQSPFIIFQGQKNHTDDEVRRTQDYIEEHYSEKITVDELAAKVALSRRSLERRFKKATANTIVQYIQRVKMEAAKKRLESTRKNVNEVMFDVGYSDEKSFRNIFKRITGLSPIDYKNRYNKEIAMS